jgi:hypothetical protein
MRFVLGAVVMALSRRRCVLVGPGGGGVIGAVFAARGRCG